VIKDINYLEIEDGTHSVGSWNHAVKNLVDAVRFMYTQLTSPEQIAEFRPVVVACQKKLQQFDYLGEPERNYFEEVRAAIESEPYPDDTRVFSVYELRMTKQGFTVLVPTNATFHYHRKAVRWVKENGRNGRQYCVQEVIKVDSPATDADCE